MTAKISDARFITRLMDATGPCTAPLDAAVEYLRVHFDRVLPTYLLAMAPHAVVAVLLIDAIAGGRQSHFSDLCLWLTAATLWRWIWLARLQYDVQRDLRDVVARNFWHRLPAVLLVRLMSNLAITWGSILLFVPAFYGIFVGGFAAPLLFESDLPAFARVRESVKWIHHAAKRLFRVTLVVSSLTLTLTLGFFAGQAALVHTVLPSLLGIDSTELAITIDSWAWRLRVLYFIFLLIDAYWTVACVFLYYDSQSRRLATDLRVRLKEIVEVST